MDQGATAWIRRCSISARGIASGSQTSVLISTPEKRWWSSRTTSNRWPSCSRLIRAPGLGDSARRAMMQRSAACGEVIAKHAHPEARSILRGESRGFHDRLPARQIRFDEFRKLLWARAAGIESQLDQSGFALGGVERITDT